MNLEQCIHCGAFINPEFGADEPAAHQDTLGTKDDPRSPGDYDNVCDVCNYAKGLRGYALRESATKGEFE